MSAWPITLRPLALWLSHFALRPIVDHARVTVMTFYLPSIPASLQTLGRCECVATCAPASLGLRIIYPLNNPAGPEGDTATAEQCSTKH